MKRAISERARDFGSAGDYAASSYHFSIGLTSAVAGKSPADRPFGFGRRLLFGRQISSMSTDRV
jgi:hypothetical protein